MRNQLDRQQVQDLWDRIERVDISGAANSVLNGKLTSQEARSLIENHIESSEPTLVVVSGVNDLEESTPSHRKSILTQLQRDMLRSLSSTERWITTTSTRCLL